MLDFNHRNPAERVIHLLDTALAEHRARQTPRDYLGGSRLGGPCARALQFEYTNTPVDPDRVITGRKFRIFDRGHASEERFADYWRMAGFDLLTEGADGKQFGFSVAGCRIKGHIDGAFTGGPANTFQYPALWEHKCLGSKGWRKLKKDGLKKAYPVYYGQCNLYMAYLNLADNPAVFTAENADTCHLYVELIDFDPGEAQRLSDRGVKVLSMCDSGQLLPRITKDPTWFECKWCDHHSTCWEMAA